MKSKYILSTSSSAQSRLELQSALYEREGKNLIFQSGIVQGMRGLEIGCGTGPMTKYLSEQVGDSGEIVVSDISQAQLDRAKENLLGSNVNNITFRLLDINQINSLDEEFDFIYIRMMLHHLKDADEAISKAVKKIKKGGVIICEEPAIYDNSLFTYPEDEQIQEFFRWGRACFETNNRDCDIAYRIERNLKLSGFKLTNHYLSQPVLNSSEERLMYSMTLNDLHDELIDKGIATENQYVEMCRYLEEVAKSDTMMTWVRMHHISAISVE